MLLSLNNSSPNFGMAIHSSPKVNNLLKSRITKTSDVYKLNKIIDAQKNNRKVDITLFAQPDGSLSANVYSRVNVGNKFFFKNYKENALSRFFCGPVGFINKLGRAADKMADSIAKSNLDIDKVLHKML